MWIRNQTTCPSYDKIICTVDWHIIWKLKNLNSWNFQETCISILCKEYRNNKVIRIPTVTCYFIYNHACKDCALGLQPNSKSHNVAEPCPDTQKFDFRVMLELKNTKLDIWGLLPWHTNSAVKKHKQCFLECPKTFLACPKRLHEHLTGKSVKC